MTFKAQPIPKPPFVLYNTVAYSGGLKPDKYVAVFDMGAGFFCVGYRIATSRVEMRAIRRVRILEGHFTVTKDDPDQFAGSMRALALTKGASDEAYLTLGQMKPFSREEELTMVKMAGNKLSRRAAEPEVEEEEEEVETPRARAKAKAARVVAAPAPARRKVAAAPVEEEEPEVEEEEEEVEEEEEEEEAPPPPKAKAKVVSRGVVAKGKAAPAPAPKAKAKAPAAPRASEPDNRRIKVLKKPHGAREGTIRAGLLDAIYASKTVQEAIDTHGLLKSDVSWAAREDYIQLI